MRAWLISRRGITGDCPDNAVIDGWMCKLDNWKQLNMTEFVGALSFAHSQNFRPTNDYYLLISFRSLVIKFLQIIR